MRSGKGRARVARALSALGAVSSLVLAIPSVHAGTYHVATDGSDETGDGSAQRPWATIDHAVDQGIPAEGGHTVLVHAGTYHGLNTISRGFADPVVVRAEEPYAAVLTNVDGGAEALRVYVMGPANLTFEDLVLTNSHPSYDCPNGRETNYLIHIQDAENVTLQNNIIFGNNAPGTCNEVLKINRSSDTAYPRNIVVRGNVFYDPANAGGADLIDSVRPGEVEIVENVFWGNRDRDRSQSFITLKRQAPSDAPSSPRFWVHRNVFLEWGGAGDQAFLQFGEDGYAEVMIGDALVENNLFIGNSPAQQAAPMQFKGVQGVEVRANTVVGDFVAGAFGFRIGTEQDNLPITDIVVRQNIFDDPTGTMADRLFNIYGDYDLDTFVLDQNLYWNEGNALPTAGALTPADDSNALEADPGLPDDQSDIVLPRWDLDQRRFESGEVTARDEFLRLVDTYGALAAGSAAIAAADPAHMPAVDIRGYPRDEEPDLGAYEHGAQGGDDGGDDGDTGDDGGDTGEGGTDNGTTGTDGQSGTGDQSGGDDDNGTQSGAASQDGDGCGCRAGTEPAWTLPLFVVVALRRRRRPSAYGKQVVSACSQSPASTSASR